MAEDIKKFDVVKVTWIQSNGIETTPKLFFVVAVDKKTNNVRVVELPNLRGINGPRVELDVKEYCSRGLEDAIKFFEQQLHLNKVQNFATFNYKIVLVWLYSHKLKKRIGEHKKKKQLLVAKYIFNTQLTPLGQPEFIIEDVKVPSKLGNIVLSLKGSFLSDSRVALLRIDYDNIEEFEKTIRVADHHELLTSSSSIGRAFAVDPLLEWIPRVQAKLKDNCEIINNDARFLYIDFRHLEDQERLYPTGLPKKVRDLLKRVAKEKTAECNLRAKLRAVLDEARALYNDIGETFSEELKKLIKETK